MARKSKLSTEKFNRDKKLTVLGFGATPSSMSTGQVCGLFKTALDCATYALDTIAVTEWVFDGPISHQDIGTTLGATINMDSGSNAGVASVYSTPGFDGGEFQTYMLACAIGVHLETPFAKWTARGNAFNAAQFLAAGVKPFSPDVWTIIDQGNPATGAGGAWAVSGAPPQAPAFLRFGNWADNGFWNFVRGYNLRWTYGSLFNLMDEPLRYTAYAPDNAQAGSSGASQLDAYKWSREANDYYLGGVGDCCLSSSLMFALSDTIRIGSVAGAGRFLPNRDFEFVDVTFGGGQLGSALSNNAEFRKLDCSYILRPGVKIGMRFEERNSDLAAEFRSEFDASAGTPNTAGGSIPGVYTESSKWNAGAGSSFVEQGLDGLPSPQTLPSQRAEFKIGPAIITKSIKGIEMSEALACMVRDNGDLAAALCGECGVVIASAG